jgi:hypothetical protein
MYGSDYFIDGVCLFVISPLAVLGSILNLVSLKVILKMIHKNDSFFFQNLKIYCVNSCIECLLCVPVFYVSSARYIGYKFDIFARVYQCIVLNYLVTSFYFICHILDLVIATDRLSIFNPRFKPLTKKNHLQIYVFI